MNHIEIRQFPEVDTIGIITRCVRKECIRNTDDTIPVYYLIESPRDYRSRPSDVDKIEEAIRAEFPDITDNMMQVVRTAPSKYSHNPEWYHIDPSNFCHCCRTAIVVNVPKEIYDAMSSKHVRYYVNL